MSRRSAAPLRSLFVMAGLFIAGPPPRLQAADTPPPPIHLKCRYFLQGTGPQQSSLHRNGDSIDSKTLSAVHQRVNAIWSRAGITLVSPPMSNAEREFQVWEIAGVPEPPPVTVISAPIDIWMQYKGIASGTSPKLYRDKLRGVERIIEGYFLHQANGSWTSLGGDPEVAVHLISSMPTGAGTPHCATEDYSGVLGLFVPELWRRCLGAPALSVNVEVAVPDNTGLYVIVVRDDVEHYNSADRIGEIVAHELGHALGLDHVDATAHRMNLMRPANSRDGGTSIDADQVRIARDNARRFPTRGPVSTVRSECRLRATP